MAKLHRVTRQRRCPICSKEKWCLIDPGGEYALCMNAETCPNAGKSCCTAQRMQTGDTAYRHRLTDEQGASWRSLPARRPAGGKLAALPVRDKVYQALIAALALSAAHREGLRRRGLSDEAIDRRGYRSLPADGPARWKIAKALRERFSDEELLSVPGLVLRKSRKGNSYLTIAGKAGLLIPVRDHRGLIQGCQVRLDGGGYVWLTSANDGGPSPGAPAHWSGPYGSQAARPRVTEGPLKADVAFELDGQPTIGLTGAGNRAPLEEALKACGAVELDVALDTDVETKEHVAKSLTGLWGEMKGGYRLHLNRWPLAQGKGIDDLLASGDKPQVLTGEPAEEELARLRELHQLPEETAPPAASPPAEGEPDRLCPQYLERDGELLVQAPGAKAATVLANFTARIREEVTIDDGLESRREYVVSGRLADGTPLAPAGVAAGKFASLDWQAEAWGSRALIHAGRSHKDHFRAALQHFANLEPPTQLTLYAHTGWRQIGGEWVYLHGGGGIGKDGAVSGVRTQLPKDLSRYCLPEPPTGEALVRAVRASLGLASSQAAHEELWLALLAATYRAVLGPADFSLFLVGPHGSGKTALATLAQQHFGPDMGSRNLPGSWLSTANANERLLFHAKDALLVIDDYKPVGGHHDVQRQQRDADRLFRAQGNNSGRARSAADGQLLNSRPPRGLMITTGEDLPPGQSLLGRAVILRVPMGAVRLPKLSPHQDDAAGGEYARAMAGYIRWLAARLPEVQGDLARQVVELRPGLSAEGQSSRAPGNLAGLSAGMSSFLRFALHIKAITPDKADDVRRALNTALGLFAKSQAEICQAESPAGRFVELVTAALRSGRCHVVRRAGKVAGGQPSAPSAWGWLTQSAAPGDSASPTFVPRGALIGWLNEKAGELLLEPGAAYAQAQAQASEEKAQSLPTKQVLWGHLHEKNMFAATDNRGGSTRYQVRRVVGGTSMIVLCLHARFFVEAEPQPQPNWPHPWPERPQVFSEWPDPTCSA